MNQNKKMFEDSLGRQRILHGFNVVYKHFPYLPNMDAFSPDFSLTEADMDDLRAWGTSVVRLGVFWEAVEMDKGVYDDEYLAKVDKIVNELGVRGIYTIIDSHQNLFSSDTCGNGVPPFYVEDLVLTCPAEWQKDFISKEVAPCKDMFEFQDIVAEDTGLVDLESCASQKLSHLYSSAQVRDGLDQFYKNKNGLFDKYLNYWTKMA
jgi:endoglycosylceramidase